MRGGRQTGRFFFSFFWRGHHGLAGGPRLRACPTLRGRGRCRGLQGPSGDPCGSGTLPRRYRDPSGPLRSPQGPPSRTSSRSSSAAAASAAAIFPALGAEWPPLSRPSLRLAVRQSRPRNARPYWTALRGVSTNQRALCRVDARHWWAWRLSPPLPVSLDQSERAARPRDPEVLGVRAAPVAATASGPRARPPPPVTSPRHRP